MFKEGGGGYCRWPAISYEKKVSMRHASSDIERGIGRERSSSKNRLIHTMC